MVLLAAHGTMQVGSTPFSVFGRQPPAAVLMAPRLLLISNLQALLHCLLLVCWVPTSWAGLVPSWLCSIHV